MDGPILLGGYVEMKLTELRPIGSRILPSAFKIQHYSHLVARIREVTSNIFYASGRWGFFLEGSEGIR